MSLPSIFAYCCTYARPQCVANIIWQWERMEYKGEKELLILDDGRQYPTEPYGEDWSIFSVKKRFNSLSDKQNAACSLATSNHDVIMVMEDDDFYAPWTLLTHAKILERELLSIPYHFYMEMQDGELRHLRNKRKHDAHAGWAFDRKLFHKVGGYSGDGIATDFELFKKFQAAGVEITNPTDMYRPYLVSRSFSQKVHLSKIEHKDPWAEAGRLADLTPVEELPPANETRDYVMEMCEAASF